MTLAGESEKSLKQLAPTSSKLGAILTPAQAELIEKFCQLLFDWNKQTNLVANANFDVLLQDHILDCLSLVPSIGQGKMTLIDIGSGAGFPGFILALALCELKVTLVEATGKKARFLENATEQLGLGNRVSVLNARAEEQAHLDHLRHSYDLATCRAVGQIDLVLELTLPFLRTGGRALLQRSLSQYQQEIDTARQYASKLGANMLEPVFPDKAVLGKDRVILVFEQVRKISGQYPRPWHKLKKSGR